MLEWNDPRPLRNVPARALATEMTDSRPDVAYTALMGAMESLIDLGEPRQNARPGNVEFMLTGYLRGLAAVAIVADAAHGTRNHTSAADFSVHGAPVEFLRPDTVLLGTLTVAFTAVVRATKLLPIWTAHASAPPVPEGHAAVVGRLRDELAKATEARMKQVAMRAEDVNGF